MARTCATIVGAGALAFAAGASKQYLFPKNCNKKITLISAGVAIVLSGGSALTYLLCHAPSRDTSDDFEFSTEKSSDDSDASNADNDVKYDTTCDDGVCAKKKTSQKKQLGATILASIAGVLMFNKLFIAGQNVIRNRK